MQHNQHQLLKLVQSCPKLWHDRLLQMFRCPALTGEDIRIFAAIFRAINLGSSVLAQSPGSLTCISDTGAYKIVDH